MSIPATADAAALRLPTYRMKRRARGRRRRRRTPPPNWKWLVAFIAGQLTFAAVNAVGVVIDDRPVAHALITASCLVSAVIAVRQLRREDGELRECDLPLLRWAALFCVAGLGCLIGGV